MDLPGQHSTHDNSLGMSFDENDDFSQAEAPDLFYDKFSIEHMQNMLIYELTQGAFTEEGRYPLLPNGTSTATSFSSLSLSCLMEIRASEAPEPAQSANDDSKTLSTDAIIYAPAWIHQGPRKAKALPSTTKVGLSRPQARRIEDCLGRQTEILQISPWCCPKYGIGSRTFSRARVDFSSTLEPKLATNSPPQEALIRLPDVLSRFPVSRSKWYAGVKAGTYPQPIKEGRRTAMWRVSDVDRLILALTTK